MKIIVRLIGGLGNQLFQVQRGYSLCKKFNARLYLDDSFLIASNKNHEKNHIDKIFHNKYQKILLGFSLVKIRKNFERYLRGFSFILFSKKIFLFDDSEIKFTESDFFIVDGFWQDKKYIDNDFISELKYAIFKNQLDSNALNLSGIVCIHIRRGDYLNNRRFFKNTQIVLDESYYKNAINFYTSQNNSYKFHIFTDDEDWAKNVFHDNYDIDIVDSKDLPPIEILKKMSSYSNFIIGNSTLSWWAAALSDGLDKVVILPKIWGVNSTSDNLSLPGWKQL